MHMHHSSTTMRSTHRQLMASVLTAAIPKLPNLSRPRSDGHQAPRRRADSARTAHLVLGCAERPERHRIPRSQSRGARHASPQDFKLFLAGPRLSRLVRLLAAATACCLLPRCTRSPGEAGRRSRPGQRRLSLIRCVARALAARRVLDSKKKEAHGCLSTCTVSHVISQCWTYAFMDRDTCISISASCGCDCCCLAAGIG